MRILSILQAQSVKAVKANGSYGYLPDAIKAVAERYNFFVAPQAAEIAAATTLVDPTQQAKPLTFYQGIVVLEGRSIVIDTLSIFQAGLIVTTRTNTKDADVVIADLLNWAAPKFDVTFEELRPSFAYSSQIDFRFESPIPQLLPRLSNLGSVITKRLSPLWEMKPAFELTTLTYSFDRISYPNFAPINLRIDRRSGHKFDDNVFWSDAPLSTDDHVAFLVEFEKTCLLSK
jgi:hypothetical protein